MSYAVARTRQELGIRIALGAAPKAILGLMLCGSAGTVGLGAIVGILAAAFSTHLARALLFGLAPNDPAAFLPAYKATETGPMIVLRHK